MFVMIFVKMSSISDAIQYVALYEGVYSGSGFALDIQTKIMIKIHINFPTA